MKYISIIIIFLVFGCDKLEPTNTNDKDKDEDKIKKVTSNKKKIKYSSPEDATVGLLKAIYIKEDYDLILKSVSGQLETRIISNPSVLMVKQHIFRMNVNKEINISKLNTEIDFLRRKTSNILVLYRIEGKDKSDKSDVNYITLVSDKKNGYWIVTNIKYDKIKTYR